MSARAWFARPPRVASPAGVAAWAAPVLVALLAAAPGSPAAAQDLPVPPELTLRPERTGWIETSRYDDVVAFARAVAAHPRIHVDTMGYTWEGRAIPLVLVGDVADPTPGSVRASGKLRVYLQGNIHAGEVPGKEALLMLLRDVAMDRAPGWLDGMVLLVAPVYNVDGNERIALGNRPRQHGPLGGMGERPNAQGYDLNRDHVKVDAPETRSLLATLERWDPQVALDLHTTNGTTHAYHLTWAPPLHPGVAPDLARLVGDRWLPAVRDRLEERHGLLTFDYGNAYDGPRGPGWYTFDHRPRFNNNYLGLRNRVAILSEAYAYLTFRERVEATRLFVDAVLEWAAGHADEIRRTVEAADRAPLVGTRLPTRAAFAAGGEVEVLMGEVARERHPWSGETILRRLDAVDPTPMADFTAFAGTEDEAVPARYLVPPGLETVVARLADHGVRATPTTADDERVVEVFRVDSVTVAERVFQGHREHTLHGRWRPERRPVPAGTLVVDMRQPLARLAFYLLEPRSDDGLAAWGLVPEDAVEDGEYPVLRVR